MTLDETSDVAWVSYQHHEDHIPYYKIDIPEDVQNLVAENAKKLTATEVST